MKKEELEKQISILKAKSYEQSSVISGKNREIEKLLEDFKKSEDEKIRIDLVHKKLKSLMETIIKILAGDSKPESKAEVITDLLSNKVNEVKENLKRIKEDSRNPYVNRYYDDYGDFN